MYTLQLLCLLILTVSPGLAQYVSLQEQTPGLQYVVGSQNTVIANVAVGLQDVKTQEPMSDSTNMMSYSLTKTVTAVAILKLQQDGLLNIDQRVAEFFPNLPYSPDLQIRHLLAQTSGLPNPIPIT